MTATYIEALDEIMTVFKDAWDAGSTPVVGYIPEIVWPGIEPEENLPTDKFWARFSNKTLDDEQSTLKGVGLRRYTIEGLAFIQIFAPLSNSEAVKKAKELATLTRNAYRGITTPSCVWFRNARIQEVGSKDKWYQINVLVNYEHDDIN